MKNKGLRLFLIYFFILIFLISPSLTYYALEGLPKEFFMALLKQGSLFSIPVVLFHKKLRLYFFLLLPVVVFAPFALIPSVLFGLDGVNTDILNLVVNTNPREATELFGSMLWQFMIALLAYVIVYIFLVRNSKKQVGIRKALVVSACGIAGILIAVFLQSGFYKIVAGTKAMLINYYPTNTIYTVARYSKMVKKIDHPALIQDFSFGAFKKDTLQARQIYLLVIGETGRYHNWGINGYHRNTTPRLEKRNDILNFSDVATAATMTEQSVPLIITRAGPASFERHYHEKSIGSVFSESGFKTYWITDQSDYFNIKMHVDEIENVIFTVGSFSKRIPIHDILVVDELNKVLSDNSDSDLFIIMHTMGSHFNYSLRYPAEFDVFKPSGEGKSFNPLKAANKEIMVNSYDNSILYTDYILDSVMNLLQKQDAVSYLLYVSDHGEDLFDDERKKSLHPPSEPSRYVAHVPFLIWTSALYDSVYPDKYSYLKKRVNSPVSSDNIFETLVDMANITYPGAEKNRSIADSAFTGSEQKVLGGDMKLYNFRDLK